MNKLETLETLREEIDKIDEEIISLIKRRVSLSEKIFDCKKEKGLSIIDNEREKEILEKATNFAMKSNFDAGAIKNIKNIFELLIEMNREHQQKLSRKGNKAP